MDNRLVKDEEVEWLLNDLLDQYGYDFTNYARASIKRRINRLVLLDHFPSFAELRYRIRSSPDYLRRVIDQLSVNVTEMFRDPTFYLMLRTQVLPMLATRPSIKIWHAGCATGEEVYSLAILLQEANLLHKSLLYATDINPSALEKARKGIFPISEIKYYSENYTLSGGRQAFSTYYRAQYDWVKFDESLGRRMILATHNLVSDGSFNEFQLIICRNVLIYFNKTLQDRVLELFDQSLENFGYLALGAKETLRFSGMITRYKQLNNEKIWQKTC